MGRKPKSKEEEKSQKLKQESVNPDNEVREEPEMDNPYLAGLKKKRASTISTQDEPEEQEANGSKVRSRKTVKKSPLRVRRSGRLQEAVMATENHYIEQIIEDITNSESEKENEPADDEFSEPTTMDEKEIHVKIEGKGIHGETDDLVELMQANQKFINELISKRIGKSLSGESSGVGEVKYKSLYFDSQKKNEALVEENKKLSKKLECAHGEIEFHKKRAEEMKEKVKEMGFILSNSSNGTKAAESASECETAKRKRGRN